MNQFKISTCITKGVSKKKECQDRLLVLQQSQYLLFALFDGHGPYGHHIAEFAKETVRLYFYKSISQRISHKNLLKLLSDCTSLHIQESQIDASNSGTTQIIILLKNNKAWCSFIGDSRAILIKSNSNKENESLLPNFDFSQLTREHKPDQMREMIRIVQAGGEVDQCKDHLGRRFGAWRVWDKSGKVPGIAMSRSIGDLNAKKLGVIQQSEYQKFTVEQDECIVMASDGVWDVISNNQVANFVGYYKDLCQKNQGYYSKNVSCQNSNISRLITEEARKRWLEQSQDFGSIQMDDISTIVIENCRIYNMANN